MRKMETNCRSVPSNVILDTGAAAGGTNQPVAEVSGWFKSSGAFPYAWEYTGGGSAAVAVTGGARVLLLLSTGGTSAVVIGLLSIARSSGANA